MHPHGIWVHPELIVRVQTWPSTPLPKKVSSSFTDRCTGSTGATAGPLTRLPPSDCQVRGRGARRLPTCVWANHRAWSPPWHPTVSRNAPAAWAEVMTAAGLSMQYVGADVRRCQPCCWLNVHRL